MSNWSNDPQLVSYPVAYSTLQYMLRVRELGAFEGPIGDMKTNPLLLPVIEALHVVLAGGEVEVKVKGRPNPDILRELNAMLEQAQKDSNFINGKAGYYVTANG